HDVSLYLPGRFGEEERAWELGGEAIEEPSAVGAEVARIERRDPVEIRTPHGADTRGGPSVTGPLPAEVPVLPAKPELLVEGDHVQVCVKDHGLHARGIEMLERLTHHRLAA